MLEYNSVSEFIDKYDAFILDIWGVIHDGEEAYPGVLKCMEQLKKAGKEIIFVSNAPRRAEKVKKVLTKFGVTENLYKAAISSGEVAWQLLAQTPKLQPENYLYIGPEKDADLLEGLNYRPVEKASAAKFALATGFDNDDSTLEEKIPQINDALANKLKMYCVNPDLIVVRQNGTKMLCAGVIGEYYSDNGGDVEFIGKPYPGIYDQAIATFSPNILKPRIAAIGDSLITDVLGANNSGIDSILILGGILKEETAPLSELISRAGATPTATLPQFNW